MQYRYLEKDLTCVKLSNLLVIEVKTISAGQVPTGEKIEMVNPDGSVMLVDKTCKGIVVEFKQEPTAEQVSKLDNLFSLQNLKRKGGKDLVAEIDDLKARIEKLESIKIG